MAQYVLHIHSLLLLNELISLNEYETSIRRRVSIRLQRLTYCNITHSIDSFRKTRKYTVFMIFAIRRLRECLASALATLFVFSTVAPSQCSPTPLSLVASSSALSLRL